MYHLQCLFLNPVTNSNRLTDNLPLALIASLQHITGFDEQAFRQAHTEALPVTSIRLNPEKIKSTDAALHFNFDCRVPWNSNGWYLKERPVFTLDPLLHGGAYYVQEASSMFLQQAMQQCCDLSQPLKVLDLCAAPGGKSTLLQSVISAGSLLVSNEVIKARANILAENITKWGAANVVVTNNDPQHFQRLPGFFDVIVVDAPCSGSGLFRRDPQAIDEWSENNVALCSQRQQRILSDVLPALKEGGILIYATCSYSKQEDEDIIDWLVADDKMSSIRLRHEESWGITETVSRNAFGYRFFPYKVKGEGFFIACFKKNEAAGSFSGKTRKQDVLPAKNQAAVSRMLRQPDDFYFLYQQDEVLAIPLWMQHDLAMLQSVLYIKKAGIKMGKLIGNELIPAHELALSSALQTGTGFIELDKHDALQYLRRQDFTVPEGHKGWCLVRYSGLGLGWAKLLANRINNYYPKDWRILMQQ
jgi:16S rRNA C967 or C1407 C5-methylase (RsmB/RsmF family)/NOL1/NOP2/fmu family ribosome biogenesis protein